jgi:hypothetical protein
MRFCIPVDKEYSYNPPGENYLRRNLPIPAEPEKNIEEEQTNLKG